MFSERRILSFFAGQQKKDKIAENKAMDGAVNVAKRICRSSADIC